jgi:hypothetical protein
LKQPLLLSLIQPELVIDIRLLSGLSTLLRDASLLHFVSDLLKLGMWGCGLEVLDELIP